MQHVVVSRFLDRTSGTYVDPGQPCPDLAPETLERLVRAGCLRRVEEKAPAPQDPTPQPQDSPASKPPKAPRKPKAPKGAAESPAAPQE